MKKFKLILSMAVIAFSVSLTACGGSNSEENANQADTETAIKECETIGNELIEALKSGNNAKADELFEKLQNLMDSINTTMAPTPEQKELLGA
ncbi:MAG: hypothetical protein K2K82_09470, partial [Muribaculaceae bacterium]|nr:hypothetical protein [Muribaculaceae bacterium]